jgi:hypothetical protein
MLGIKDLRKVIRITKSTIECPVKGCDKSVSRQRKSFKREEPFQCPEHQIYISATTFEYPSESDNLLWNHPEDKTLLSNIKKVKRESRMARDNSEDAVSWNIFRYLEKCNLVSKWLSEISGMYQELEDVIYWSYSQKENQSWSLLNKARLEFGEMPKRSSEPDIIIKTKSSIFFIEAKLTATNQTSGKKQTLEKRVSNPKKYLEGGGNWFAKVFSSDYDKIIYDQKYELMRFWLLGTWIAQQSRSDFYLINLVLEDRELGIHDSFLRHIHTNSKYRFFRLSWEDIYRFVLRSSTDNALKTQALTYFENKTIGYNHYDSLQKAFSI